MKRFLVAIILLSNFSKAQQRPQYSQYIMNNYIVNPAIGGIENYVDVKISNRNQWIGINGAPKTFYATIHGPLGKKDYRESVSSLDMKGYNPRGREYWENYESAAPHHGLGIVLVNYQTGYINRSTTYATYSYHLGLNATTSLSGGFGLGFSSIGINSSMISLANGYDPAIGSTINDISKIKPEMNAGLWLYSSRYFVGLSAQQIVPVKLNLVNNAAYKSTLIPHLFATAGYRIQVGEDLSLLPSVMLRYIATLPLGVDASAKLQFRDLMWISSNFKRNDGAAYMFGVNVAHTVNISYAFDLSRGKYLLSTMNKGTHELILGFTLNNKYGDLCPRNIW